MVLISLLQACTGNASRAAVKQEICGMARGDQRLVLLAQVSFARRIFFRRTSSDRWVSASIDSQCH